MASNISTSEVIEYIKSLASDKTISDIWIKIREYIPKIIDNLERLKDADESQIENIIDEHIKSIEEPNVEDEQTKKIISACLEPLFCNPNGYTFDDIENTKKYINFLKDFSKLKREIRKTEFNDTMKKIFDLYNNYRKPNNNIKQFGTSHYSIFLSLYFPKIFYPLKSEQGHRATGFINDISYERFISKYTDVEKKKLSTMKIEKYREFIGNIYRDKALQDYVSQLDYGLLEVAFYFAIKWDLERKLGKAKGKSGRKDNSLDGGSASETETLIKPITLDQYYGGTGLLFNRWDIAQFYVALKTKGFVILSGISGTGKTKLAQYFAKLIEGRDEQTHIFLSVRPDWTDPKHLIGYYNPITDEYVNKDFINFLKRAYEEYKREGRNAKPYIIILDEMNLAHVEYYFSDFLSILESGRDSKCLTEESIKIHSIDKLENEGVPMELNLPPNLYIVGTVNIDETTYTFSPKVLDRAFTIEIHNVDLDKYGELGKEHREKEGGGDDLAEKLRSSIIEDLKGGNNEFIRRTFTCVSKEDILKAIEKLREKEDSYFEFLNILNMALKPFDLHFGYRVVDEITLFYINAMESWRKEIVGFESEDEIFDLAIKMKILPKFHGNRRRLEKPLLILLELLKRRDKQDEKVEDYRDLGRRGVEELYKTVFGAEYGLDLISVVTEKIEDIEKSLARGEGHSEYRFKHTALKCLRMLRSLYETGYTSFY